MAKPWTDELHCSDLGFSCVAGKLYWVIFIFFRSEALETSKYLSLLWNMNGQWSWWRSKPVTFYCLIYFKSVKSPGCWRSVVINGFVVLLLWFRLQDRNTAFTFQVLFFLFFCYEVTDESCLKAKWRHGLSVFKNYANDNKISACINIKTEKQRDREKRN